MISVTSTAVLINAVVCILIAVLVAREALRERDRRGGTKPRRRR